MKTFDRIHMIRRIARNIFIATAILIIAGFMYKKFGQKKSGGLLYVITETTPATSFDPLDADKTQNISVMRMMYLTPLEVNSNNVLVSKVLSSFSYNPESRKIIFIVRDNLHFSDGSKLSVIDVELAIKRMAYFRPEFPVIKDIDGVETWAAQKSGLETRPKGIEVKDNIITITLKRNKLNPLFRFCLELFSIIPHNCVNPKNGRLLCNIPPESGYYKYSSSDNETFQFKKRLQMIDTHSREGFETINFNYRSLSQLCREQLPINTVVTGGELDFITSEDCKKRMSSMAVHWLPASRFGVLRFNPNVELFKNSNCRATFANEVKNFLQSNYSDLNVELSLFTKIVPGYLPSNRLEKKSSSSCLRYFKNKKISLSRLSNSSIAIISNAIIAAAKNLGMNILDVKNLTPEAQLEYFLSGSTPVVAGSSGFWALDPVGDMVMWFTPGLHRTMSFVWNDKRLYSIIDKLDQELNESEQKYHAEILNMYLSKQSIIAPIVHFKRIYLTNIRADNISLPQAVTSPAPWQVLPAEL